MNKLDGGVLKIVGIQGELLRNDGVDGRENNDKIGNGLRDRYTHDRQQLILSPSLCEKNL